MDRPARPGDLRHSQADIRLSRRLLGYRPLVDFEEGLRRTMEWYAEALDEAKPRPKPTAHRQARAA